MPLIMLATIILAGGIGLLAFWAARLFLSGRTKLKAGYANYLDAAFESVGGMLTPEDVLRISLACAGVGAMAGLLLGLRGGTVLVFLLGGGLGTAGFVVPNLALRYIVHRRTMHFLQLLPDALDMICKCLAGGQTVERAVRVVAQEMPSPLRDEFRQAQRMNEEFNVSLTEALKLIADRVRIPEARMFALVLDIQTEVGGDVTGALRGLADTVRNRFNVERKVHVLTTSARMEGIFIAASPLLVVGGFALSSPELLTGFFSSPFGPVAVGLALVLETIGCYLMWKLSKIKY